MQISGLIIAFNEEKNIEECVRSLFKVCSEVIVVDSFSTDNTVFLAEKEGAQVVRQHFLGDGPQRSFGLRSCQNNWVLNLDADERLDDDAVELIKELDLARTKYEAFELKRKNFIGNKWIKIADWYPDYIRRLFDKRKTDFSSVRTHSKIKSSHYARLDCHILHYSFTGYADLIERINKYTSWQAETLFKEGERVMFIAPISHGVFSFFKHYFIKKGMLGGMDGLTISLLTAVGSYMKYAKLCELKEISTIEMGEK